MPITSLIKGNQLFKEVFFKLHEKEFDQLVQDGQSPSVLFITCSDSRVLPDIITQAPPGHLFTNRNPGNLVPTYESRFSYPSVPATIELAIENLGVKDIIICGHSHCVACASLYQPEQIPTEDCFSYWLQQNKEIKAMKLEEQFTDEEELLRATEKLSVIVQVENLLTYPKIKVLVDEQKLFLHAWYYLIETGDIHYYDHIRQNFFPLSELLSSDESAS